MRRVFKAVPMIILALFLSNSEVLAFNPVETKIIAADDDNPAYDYFGGSVSVSGDYAIAGAKCDEHIATYAGSAYIFHRSGTVWTQQAKLTAGDGEQGDNFGSSVSVSGDYAIVGAYYDKDEDDPLNHYGSAYVFYRDGTAWTQQARLTASDGGPEDRFGMSVCVSGDYAVVGSNYDDDNGTNSGSAYIFYRNGSVWEEQGKLIAGDNAEGDFFGRSVSVSGDYAIVGAPNDDDGGSSSGSAYIFHRSESAWTQTCKLTADDSASGDLFGNSVSISGDYAIAGAYFGDDNGSMSGKAYIFFRNGDGTWTQQDKLTASDGAERDHFGNSVGIGGECVIAGAYYDDDNGTNSGSAYIYDISPKPEISVSPARYETEVTSGSGTDETLIISNVGGEPLTWSSASGASAWLTLSPASGEIASGGSESVTLTFDAADLEAGEYSESVIISGNDPNHPTLEIPVTLTVSESPVSVNITSLADGAEVTGNEIMITGTCTGSDGEGLGVTISGTAAQVCGDSFFANRVMLTEGENTITVTVTDEDGNTASSTVTVTSAESETGISLTLFPESGIAPLETELDADYSIPGTAADSSVECAGPAQPTITKISLTEYDLIFDTPGLYTVTYRITDTDGAEYTKEAMVCVRDKDETDAFFRASWTGMRNALVAGNIETACGYFMSDRREDYSQAFTALSAEQRNKIPAADRMELVGSSGGETRYAISMETEISGEVRTVGSWLIFRKDRDGFWRIGFF
ncbi:hypothetical protein DENIS_3252 [Desulfonema ishimotonii]|uniref:HYDIN/VesB/CFA65-like Ig-like domain-containing protein n=1 Tax=Desulfonema ishimotonii TaxID=45657 RepID=A0A401FZC1_9BACT|nr:hypothetical protein [Desulfonema ishimotonii]GBC62283.1 hypothetical protein DENIS_3252 [Desulfonema ishimotonii]